MHECMMYRFFFFSDTAEPCLTILGLYILPALTFTTAAPSELP
ncbi:unnamed protein product [Ixodes pacificus]